MLMMKRVLVPFLIFLSGSMSLAQTEDVASRSSFNTYEVGQSPCFVTDEYKKMYYKCQNISEFAQPYAKSQTCGQPTTIPPSKVSSCGLQDGEATLLVHNSLRERWGAAPLLWSKVLSDSAQAVADTCNVMPSGSEFGENMLLSSEELTCSKASKFWHESETLWATLGADQPDFYPDTASFSQQVWKSTLQIGCAKRRCDSGDLVVCHYYPPGNIVGGSNFAENIGMQGEVSPCTTTTDST